jgi:hypothetical protein
LDDADDEVRARLEIPDEMLDSTEAHDLRLADFVDGEVEDAREGDLSLRYASGVAVASVLLPGGVDPGESDCLIVVGVSAKWTGRG